MLLVGFVRGGKAGDQHGVDQQVQKPMHVRVLDPGVAVAWSGAAARRALLAVFGAQGRNAASCGGLTNTLVNVLFIFA